MREFLNAILASFGAEALTDEEFNSWPLETAANDNQTYISLDAILAGRDSISDSRDRLRHYFLMKGVPVQLVEGQGTSNILIGCVL